MKNPISFDPSRYPRKYLCRPMNEKEYVYVLIGIKKDEPDEKVCGVYRSQKKACDASLKSYRKESWFFLFIEKFELM